MLRIDTVIADPRRCSDPDLAAFVDLVRQGEEVDEIGLDERARNAKALVFQNVDGTLVGVAALKRPHKDYRDHVFQSAEVPEAAGRFTLELGWVFVLPGHRGKKYSGVVSTAAMSQAEGLATFATTRLDNVAMQRTLENLAFRRFGIPWRSKRGKKPLLALYVAT